MNKKKLGMLPSRSLKAMNERQDWAVAEATFMINLTMSAHSCGCMGNTATEAEKKTHKNVSVMLTKPCTYVYMYMYIYIYIYV